MTDSRSVSYKEALPPGDWPRLGRYLAGLMQTQKRGNKPDVSQYLREIHLANKAKRARQAAGRGDGMNRVKARIVYALKHINSCPPGVVCDYKLKCEHCWEAWIYGEKV